MFRFIILSALVAMAIAKPSVFGENLEVAAPVAVETHAIEVPAAVSTSFRKDVIHKPVVTTYTVPEVVGHKEVVEKVLAPAPIIEKTFVQPASIVEKTFVQPAPIIEKTVVQPAPIVEKTVIQPASESHVYRKDVIGKPIVSIHSTPVVTPVVTPVIEKTIVQPSVLAHTLRSDFISQPLVRFEHAPLVAASLVENSFVEPIGLARFDLNQHNFGYLEPFGYAGRIPALRTW